MDLLFHYYDMFCLLERGYYLIKFGYDDQDPIYWLDGYIASNALSPVFIKNNWVEKNIIEDNGARIFYTPSNAGKEIFKELKQWYYSLPIWYRLLGRIGI